MKNGLSRLRRNLRKLRGEESSATVGEQSVARNASVQLIIATRPLARWGWPGGAKERVHRANSQWLHNWRSL